MGKALLVLVIGCLFFPASAAAQVVINEFMANPVGSDSDGEWIELYNTSDEVVNLDQWMLVDAAEKQIVIDQRTIEPHHFVVFYRNGGSLALNNTGKETVKLVDATESGRVVDEVVYEGSSEGLSWGRVPDGTGTWQADLPATAGTANQLPTPSPTPKPTNSPKPTKSPKPKKQKVSEDVTAESSNGEHDNEFEPTPGFSSDISLFEDVLGESTFSATLSAVGVVDLATASASDAATHKSASNGNTAPWPWMWFLGGGVLLSAGAGPSVWRVVRQRFS